MDRGEGMKLTRKYLEKSVASPRRVAYKVFQTTYILAGHFGALRMLICEPC